MIHVEWGLPLEIILECDGCGDVTAGPELQPSGWALVCAGLGCGSFAFCSATCLAAWADRDARAMLGGDCGERPCDPTDPYHFDMDVPF